MMHGKPIERPARGQGSGSLSGGLWPAWWAEKPPTPKGECPTGKRIFYKERLANRAVTEAAKRGELPPMRHYACADCGYWHLSRKKQPPGRRDNAC